MAIAEAARSRLRQMCGVPTVTLQRLQEHMQDASRYSKAERHDFYLAIARGRGDRQSRRFTVNDCVDIRRTLASYERLYREVAQRSEGMVSKHAHNEAVRR
jgi:hypothetical protein